MGISRFEFEPEVEPQTVAAVVAAVLHYYEDEEAMEKPYVSFKNKGWKNLCHQENCWGLSRFRY